MDEHPDARLVEEARQGGREAFAELVRRHERRVYGVAWRMAGNASDADDLAQEVFLTAWKAIGSFRSGSGFYAWLQEAPSRDPDASVRAELAKTPPGGGVGPRARRQDQAGPLPRF